MSMKSKRNALIKWVELSLNLPVGKVVWYQQNAPRPQKPYVSLHMGTSKTIGREQVLPVNEEGAAIIISHREVTLSVFNFVPDNVDPVEMLMILQASLDSTKIRELFEAEDIAYAKTISGPQDVTFKLDTLLEQRATMDLIFRMPWEFNDADQGMITVVGIEGVAINLGGVTVAAMTLNPGNAFDPPIITLNGIYVSTDTLNERIAVTVGIDIYNLKYDSATIVTINSVVSTIADLLVDDSLVMEYFEYAGEHNLKTVTATRT